MNSARYVHLASSSKAPLRHVAMWAQNAKHRARKDLKGMQDEVPLAPDESKAARGLDFSLFDLIIDTGTHSLLISVGVFE